MKKVALYPGTFDPVTNGHIDIIKRACTIFDEVVVAIAESTDKKPMFSLDRREEMLKVATEEMPHVQVRTFDTLLVDFAKELGTNNIIRGLRAISDFEYELQLSYANSSLNPDIETIFLMPTLENAFISSSVVRAILKHHGSITHLVPNEILPFIDKDSYVCAI
jgi:pantetheine-phosphate adenylyltransferase